MCHILYHDCHLTVNSACLLQYYLDHDQKLKKFVPIIHNSVVYPVVLDSDGTVASLPPVINGARSAVRQLHIMQICAFSAAKSVAHMRLSDAQTQSEWYSSIAMH